MRKNLPILFSFSFSFAMKIRRAENSVIAVKRDILRSLTIYPLLFPRTKVGRISERKATWKFVDIVVATVRCKVPKSFVRPTTTMISLDKLWQRSLRVETWQEISRYMSPPVYEHSLGDVTKKERHVKDADTWRLLTLR